MSTKAKFRYPLEPVRLKRQWELDALLLDLSQLNGMLDTLKSDLDKMDEEERRVADEWKRQSASDAIDVSHFMRMTHYMQELSVQREARKKELADMERQRDLLIDRVVAAQRGVDALESHRDDMKAEFIKMRQSSDFKAADDHWSTLQTRMENHDNRS